MVSGQERGTGGEPDATGGATTGETSTGGTTTGSGGGGGLHDLVKAESMIQLAIALPAGCLLGWLGGSWADRHFHQGWIGVTGILLGAAAGFIQIFRTASGYLKRDT